MSDLVAPDAAAPHIALWDHPLDHPNIEDAQIAHTLAPLGRVPVVGRLEGAYRKRLRLKSWQYMTVVSDELFLAFVVGTAGFASNGFVYAAELPSGRVHQRFAITPLRLGTQLAPSSTAGAHRIRTRNLAIAIQNQAGGRRFDVEITAETEAGGALAAALVFDSDAADEHLGLCVPLPGGRWNYTHKLAGFRVSGHVTLDGRRIGLAADRSFGTLDFTKMYALRHAVWKWVTLCGRSKRGALIGLNLVDPTPSAAVSENALWVDGKREPIRDVHLEVDPPGDASCGWQVAAESVDLTMRTIAHVEQKLDVPLVRHRLRHVIGAFSGRVRTVSGQTHDLDSIIGIAEDNDTWW